MPIMSLVSYLKDIKQQNKQIIKLIQCNDYLAYDIDCIKNKIACELSLVYLTASGFNSLLAV